MKTLVLLFAVSAVFVTPTALIWLLGRRARIPGRLLIGFLAAGWLTVLAGGALSQRAQPTLFPDTSPCYGTGGTPVSRYFPPDSFCRHADGELRTVNGPNAKLVFWTAAGGTTVMAVAAAFARRRRP
ncbi:MULTISPECIES: hypothetical protein [Streptomyces]|uniref:hypothetical protein n=1 Tax=Streptomyces TaxID=1883 RepID=UPI001679A696|nr:MULTISPECIES: hypothetical protein [Streptomyces]MBK3527006.1 hypothetical protein [Streptomyces sp. MBT70]